MKFNKKSKGSALLYAIVIIATTSVIALGVAQNTIKKTQTQAQEVDGIQAFFLAESATEIAFTARNIYPLQYIPICSNGGTPPCHRNICTKGESNDFTARAVLDDDFNSWELQFNIVRSSTTATIPNQKTLDLRVYQPRDPGITDLGFDDPFIFLNKRVFLIQSTGYFGQSNTTLNAAITTSTATPGVGDFPKFIPKNDFYFRNSMPTYQAQTDC